MDLDLIERLIGLVERSRVTELDYAEGGVRVRIVRGDGTRPSLDVHPVAQALTAATEPDRITADPGAGHTIAAGMPGTFYRAPAPGEPPFVSVGDKVEDGQTLAILEAMKMLNPVEADRPGRILAIPVENGAVVEAGTPLFHIGPED